MFEVLGYVYHTRTMIGSLRSSIGHYSGLAQNSKDLPAKLWFLKFRVLHVRLSQRSEIHAASRKP